MYTVKTGELVLVYDWTTPAQLKDFDVSKAKPALAHGTIALEPGDSISHVVDFRTVTIAAPVLVPEMRGVMIKTSGGAIARVGGQWPDTMYLEDGKATVQLVVPDRRRKGVQPIELTIAESRIQFKYGIGSPSQVSKRVADLRAGRTELRGGDAGFHYGTLVLTGKIDKEWAEQFVQH